MANQDQQPAAPVSGLGGFLSVVQAVVSIVPRWLVVAAGVIFLTWSSLEIYIGVQSQLLDLQIKRVNTVANTGTVSHADMGATADGKPATKSFEACLSEMKNSHPDFSARALDRLARSCAGAPLGQYLAPEDKP